MSCMPAIQAICAETMDIAMVTTGLDGTPLSGASSSCDSCTLILATERGRVHCAEPWRRSPDGQFYSCHAGLLCSSLPVSVDGQPVALVAACQFVALQPNGTEPTWQLPLPELASGLSLAEADLRATASSVRVLAESHLLRVPRLLHRVAETFSEIAQERSDLFGSLEKIAEMSKI